MGCGRPLKADNSVRFFYADTRMNMLVAMREQPSSSAYSKKNKVENLVQLDKLEKNDRDTMKINSWLLPCSPRSHRTANSTPENGLRHFSALPTHHPTSGRNKKICS